MKSAEADVCLVDTSTQVRQVGRRRLRLLTWRGYIVYHGCVKWADGRRRRRQIWWYYVIQMGPSSEPTPTSAVGWLDGTMLFLWDRQVSWRPTMALSRFSKKYHRKKIQGKSSWVALFQTDKLKKLWKFAQLLGLVQRFKMHFLNSPITSPLRRVGDPIKNAYMNQLRRNFL